jgi:hypothetical protein
MVHHALTDECPVDAGADGGHDAARLVAGDDGPACAEPECGGGVARRSIWMQVAAAHARSLHLENDLARAGRGIGEVLELELAVAEENDAAHGDLLVGGHLITCYGLR